MPEYFHGFDPIFTSGKKGITAIVGLSKNAGKTSTLNHIIATYPKLRFGVMSTGRDGEDSDLVFGNIKPPVKLCANTIFCCDTRMLQKHGSAIRILSKLPWQVSDREIWLVSALTELQTEIIGPSNVSDQIHCAQMMRGFGSAHVLIDGSLDRMSIVLSKDVSAVILVVGAGYGSMERITAELRRIMMLSSIPISSSSPPQRQIQEDTILCHRGSKWENTGIRSILDKSAIRENFLSEPATKVYIPGAITENLVTPLTKKLLQGGAKLLIRHPHNLKLSLNSVERLLQAVEVSTLIPFRVDALALNSSAIGMDPIDVELMRSRIKMAFTGIPIMDIMDLYEK